MWPRLSSEKPRATQKPRPATATKLPNPKTAPQSTEEDWTSKTWGRAMTEDGGSRYSDQRGPRRSPASDTGTPRGSFPNGGVETRAQSSVRPAPWERAGRPAVDGGGARTADVSRERMRAADVSRERRQGEGGGDFAVPRRKPSYEREGAGDGVPSKELPGTSNANVLLGRSLEELTAFAVEQGEVRADKVVKRNVYVSKSADCRDTKVRFPDPPIAFCKMW